MRKMSITCKECKFWFQYVRNDQKNGPDLMSFGICIRPGSNKWFLSMHKDDCCENGELKETDIIPPKT